MYKHIYNLDVYVCMCVCVCVCARACVYVCVCSKAFSYKKEAMQEINNKLLLRIRNSSFPTHFCFISLVSFIKAGDEYIIGG